MRSKPGRLATVLLATVAVLAAAAAPLAAQTRPIYIRPGAPGEPSRQLTAEEIRNLVPGTPGTPSAYSEADVEFMQHMILHHGQAQEMSQWALDGRADWERIHTLANRIHFAQQSEINRMQAWLAERGEDVPDPGDHRHHHHDMPGMATPEQLDELEALEGRAFDVRFLELMIPHHQGAVIMVEQLVQSGQPINPEVSVLASDIEADQRAEVGRMQFLLLQLEQMD